MCFIKTNHPIIPKKIESYLSLLIGSFTVATKPKYTPHPSRRVSSQIFRLENSFSINYPILEKSQDTENIPFLGQAYSCQDNFSMTKLLNLTV